MAIGTPIPLRLSYLNTCILPIKINKNTSQFVIVSLCLILTLIDLYIQYIYLKYEDRRLIDYIIGPFWLCTLAPRLPNWESSSVRILGIQTTGTSGLRSF